MLGVFDLQEFPLAQYHLGPICAADDAAHASSPHHGAGAGMGIEDALCLCTLMVEVTGTARAGEREVEWAETLAAALRIYDGMRRRRSQWLVNSSRRVCELQHSKDLAHPMHWVRAETCFEETLDRTLKIWNFDARAMVKQTAENYTKAINDVVARRNV